MIEFKEKIYEVLQQMNYSVGELAEHLGMTHDELSFAIENKKVELRTLENISKELRIPLYSFFDSEDYVPVKRNNETPFYINKASQDIVDALQKENSMLKNELEKLRLQLSSCQNNVNMNL